MKESRVNPPAAGFEALRNEGQTSMGEYSYLFLIAAAALNIPTRNGYNAQSVNLRFHVVLSFLV